MKDEEVDDNGSSCCDSSSWIPEGSVEDRRQLSLQGIESCDECDEEDCLWLTDEEEEDDNGVLSSFACEDSKAAELQNSVQDKHDDPGGAKLDFLEEEEHRNLDERQPATTSYEDSTRLATKKQNDDSGGVIQDGAERSRTSTRRVNDDVNQDEANKDQDVVEESIHILSDPKVLSSFQVDSENIANAEKVGGFLPQNRRDENIGECIRDSQKTPKDDQSLTQKTPKDDRSLTQKTPEDDRSLTQKTSEDERSLTQKTPEDDRSLTQKTPEDDRSLTQKTPKDDRSLTQKTPEDERSLTQKTPEDDRSLTQKTPEDDRSPTQKTPKDDRSLTQKTSEDERSPTQKILNDERSLTDPVEDETEGRQRQSVLCVPVDFSDTGDGFPASGIKREDDASSKRRIKLKAVSDGVTEEFDPGPTDGEERERTLQLNNKDSNARKATLEPDESSSQAADCGTSKQRVKNSTKAEKPSSISTSLNLLLLMVSFPVLGLFQGVDGALTVIPGDVLAQSGSLARLRCSTDYGSPVYWERMLFGTDEQQTIYYGKNGMARIPGNRFSIEEDSTSGRYDLVISNVQPEDAGTYICIDEAGIGEGYRAELVVSERFTCMMSVPTNGFMGENIFDITEDPVESTCSLRFRGNIVPGFNWTWGKETVVVSPTVINGSTATSTVKFRATHDRNGNSLTCLASISTDSTSLDDSGWWKSEPVSVRYVHVKFGSVDGCQSNAMIPDCNPKCTYETQKTDDEKCRCLAMYSDQGKNYSKTFNEYTCGIAVLPRNTVIAVMTICAIIVAVIAASGGIYIYRMKCTGKESQVQEIQKNEENRQLKDTTDNNVNTAKGNEKKYRLWSVLFKPRKAFCL